MIKVSVVIPVYNVEEYVAECIDSVLNQTLKDIELIIINDGSPDNSEAIIKKYSDKRICYYKKENGGLSDARNYAIDKIKGKYVLFLDSDDLILPNFLEEAYNILEKEQSDMLQGRAIYFGDVKPYLARYPLYNNKKDLLRDAFVACGDKVYKTSIIKEHNLSFPKGLWYEDIPFFESFVLNAKKFSVLNKGVYNYRQRASSITSTVSDRILEIIDVLDLNIRYYKENNFYDTYYDELEYFTLKIILGSSFKRVLKYQDQKKRLEGIEKTYKFLINNFPNYKKNKYLRGSIKNLFFKYSSLKLLKLIGILYSFKK